MTFYAVSWNGGYSPMFLRYLDASAFASKRRNLHAEVHEFEVRPDSDEPAEFIAVVARHRPVTASRGPR